MGSLKQTRCGATIPTELSCDIVLESKENKNPVGLKKADWATPALAVFIERPQADGSNRRYGRKLPFDLGKVKLPFNDQLRFGLKIEAFDLFLNLCAFL